MRSLTKNTGKRDEAPVAINPESIRKILIIRPNHRLGNMLLVTPIVQEVSNRFPNAEITLFAKGYIARVIFQEYPAVKAIISLPRKAFKQLFRYVFIWFKLATKSYDLAVNVIPFSSSGRIATRLVRARHKFYGAPDPHTLAHYPDFKQQACFAVLGLREFLRQSGVPLADNLPVPVMNMQLLPEELEKGQSLVRQLCQTDKEVIALFTYATGDKCFDRSFWVPFYQQLQQRYPQYAFVEVLPIEHVSQIDFKASSFYSKDIREIAAFIANCRLFIGADSGMMHLASAALTPTLGLFSVTDIESFKPYGNNSRALAIKDNQFADCFPLIDCILDEKHLQAPKNL